VGTEGNGPVANDASGIWSPVCARAVPVTNIFFVRFVIQVTVSVAASASKSVPL